MRQIAATRGGECLSDRYKSAHAPLRWRCAKGHEWETPAAAVRNRGSWCPACMREVAASKTRLGIEVARELAAERGGVCLTEEYPKERRKIFRWRCADGHEWESTLMAARHAGQWCPVCASGLGERLCRSLFERIFDAPFAKARPKWLVNERGKRMELDGLNSALKIAFEYQGRQHFTYVPFFHQGQSLDQRMRDDAQKAALCKAHGITLIAIPQTVDQAQMQEFIYCECDRQGLRVERKPPIDLALLEFYPSFDLQRMRDYARAKGGECLAEYFPGVAVKVRWRCAKGHEWMTSFHEVKRRNGWCPQCSVNHPLALADMQRLAKERGGELLSTEYINVAQNLRWKCAKGHEWEATGNMVRNASSWCPHCAGVARKSIDDAQRYAAERGGQCLSEHYVNGRTKLRWRCAKGHEWEAAPATVTSRGTWCPVCAGKARLTIPEMQRLAAERGGTCLSTRYVNLATKLRWRCAKGHVWAATPNNIKHGASWCPKCVGDMAQK
jgi:hypothetical protein